MNINNGNTELEEYYEIQPSIVKSQQVQLTTHLEILAVGNKVYKKATDEQRKYLEEQLSKHENKIRLQMQKEHENNMKILHDEHNMNVELLKQEFSDLQNIALREEASRVKAVMNKEADQLIAETVLEGQKKLHAALVNAREKFELEKKEAIDETIKTQELITAERLKELQDSHLNDVKLLKDEWKRIKEDLSKEHFLKLKNMLAKQKEELHSAFKMQLQDALQSAQNKHEEEMNNLHSSIEQVHKEKETLQNEINTLENKLVIMNENVNKILQSFQEFIELSPGFAAGQSDFLLDNLIPAGLEEFIKTH